MVAEGDRRPDHRLGQPGERDEPRNPSSTGIDRPQDLVRRWCCLAGCEARRGPDRRCMPDWDPAQEDGL